MKKRPGIFAGSLFLFLILGGIGYCAFSIASDTGNVSQVGAPAFFLLTLALLIALGFEFVNGFHDTANAVATVIYTHSMDPLAAVIWSGIWNLIGVLTSSGAVAFAVVSLLPAELILQVSSGAGFAMVFALLVAAILWNLGTWWLGLPASSSHTMIGSILGVGLANGWMSAHHSTAGVDWEQVIKVFRVLLISPVVGFGFAALLMWIARKTIHYPELFTTPKDGEPPPFPIRLLLIGALTMGLIALKPPSIGSTCPVTQLLWSDNNQAIAEAPSSTEPWRPKGYWAAICFSALGANSLSVSGERISPGAMALTRMPLPA